MSNLSQNEACILNLFVLMSDEQYKCFPSVGTITKMTKMCVTSYKKAINNLIDMGLVRRQFRYNKETGQQRSNYFHLRSFLFSGNQNSVTILINKAKAALERKKRSKQMELPLTAYVSQASRPSNSKKKASNKLCSLPNKLIAKASKKIKDFWTSICKSKKNHGPHAVLTKKHLIFNNILRLVFPRAQKEAQISFTFNREGSRDDHIYFSFISRKRKI